MKSKKLKILLAAPRGFCAGVDRAIEIVKKSINKFGAPVYVRHEIVHNKYVVDNLKEEGAIFVEELNEIDQLNRPVIFSAHGVPKSVPKEAEQLKLLYFDATCPLVSKIHREIENFERMKVDVSDLKRDRFEETRRSDAEKESRAAAERRSLVFEQIYERGQRRESNVSTSESEEDGDGDGGCREVSGGSSTHVFSSSVHSGAGRAASRQHGRRGRCKIHPLLRCYR